LEVLGHEEEPAHEHTVEQKAGGVRAGASAVGEQPQRQQRLRGARLASDEGCEQEHAGSEREQRRGCAPADLCGVDDAEDQRGRSER
jgi:hypothetical protein